MCLETVDDPKTINEFKKTIPSKGITVYKVVFVGNGKYYPMHEYRLIPFKQGLDEAITTEKIRTHIWTDNYITYQAGFHFFTNKKDAEKYKKYVESNHFKDCPDFAIIECVIKKSWITTVGKNSICFNSYGQTVVTNKAIFPEFKEEE